jgi:hypothetical protein
MRSGHEPLGLRSWIGRIPGASLSGLGLLLVIALLPSAAPVLRLQQPPPRFNLTGSHPDIPASGAGRKATDTYAVRIDAVHEGIIRLEEMRNLLRDLTDTVRRVVEQTVRDSV